MPDPTTDKLKDRIQELESALKEIETLSMSGDTIWKIVVKIHEIATRALWPV